MTCSFLCPLGAGSPVGTQLLEGLCTAPRAADISRAFGGAFAVPISQPGARVLRWDGLANQLLHVGNGGPRVCVTIAEGAVANAHDPPPPRSLHEGHCSSCGLHLHTWAPHARTAGADVLAGGNPLRTASSTIF